MQRSWMRCQKWCVALSSGGITLGIIQGFGLINFASFFANFFSTWLAVLVTLLLGGNVSNLFGGGGTGTL